VTISSAQLGYLLSGIGMHRHASANSMCPKEEA